MREIKGGGKTVAKLLAAGAAAGVVNGLLGAGGGIIIVFVVTHLLSDKLADKKDVFSMALCIMLPISLLSYITYSMRGHVSAEGFEVFILPAVLGGALGGLLLGKLKATFMRRLFATLVVISGILLILR